MNWSNPLRRHSVVYGLRNKLAIHFSLAHIQNALDYFNLGKLKADMVNLTETKY